MNPWEEHARQILKRLSKKEKAVLKEIRKQYEIITREIMADLSDIYARLEPNGPLTYADVQRYNDLNRFKQRVAAQTVLLGSFNRNKILNLLEEGYDLSYSYMSYAIEMEAGVLLAGATPNMPMILQQVWDNPIKGLRLEPALQRDRKLIVADINEAIERGLIEGETYGGIAKNIKAAFHSSYERAVRISQTETHRVREKATHQSAINADNQGVKMIKIWRNMADEKVRKTKKANHRDIEGQTIPVNDPFIALSGASGMAPGNMGRAEEDINCRCYASHRVSHIESQVPKQAIKQTFDDWYKTKRGE